MQQTGGRRAVPREWDPPGCRFSPYDGLDFSLKQRQPVAAACRQMTLDLTVNAPNASMSVCRLKSGSHGDRK